MTGWIMAGALLWAVLSVPVGILVGRVIRLADRRSRRPDDGKMGR